VIHLLMRWCCGPDSHSMISGARGNGFKNGTNAVRRAAYARRLFPEAEIMHYRGAADKRVRKLDNGEL
jgi:hydroxymethylbilane synthase